MNSTKSLLQKKLDGDCYFCGKPAKDSTETVNGKPDDYKVCPGCFNQYAGEIRSSRAMARQFDAMF
jgi:hypothetical protein